MIPARLPSLMLALAAAFLALPTAGCLEPFAGEDADGDGFLVETDCDDTDPRVHSTAEEIACDGKDTDCDGDLAPDEDDSDQDGASPCDGDCDDTDPTVHPGDADADGFSPCGGDCDDADAGVHPGAFEASCDGVDGDCDGALPADETDGDADGATPCEGDCDDADASVGPGAPEACDGVDSDCDGVPGTEEEDSDGDGASPCDGDCDDTAPLVHLGAPELCDGVDTDCDGAPRDDETDGDGDGDLACGGDCDDADAGLHSGDLDGDGLSTCQGDCDDSDASLDRTDADADGWSTCAGDCDDADPGRAPVDADGDGVSLCDGDCDDADPSVSPGAPEVCNGVDDDCDGEVDEEADGDGDGWTPCGGDCDDADPARYPGAGERCNGLDDDCNGAIPPSEMLDADADGSPACADCADADPARSPGATEVCDGRDNDCDLAVPADESDVDVDGAMPCGGDCDDGNSGAHPGAPELCDGFDNDCDGGVDEDGAAGAPTWYLDGDGDGYGLDGSSAVACAAPPDHAALPGDCDDASAARHPGAAEQCNGIDDDCNAFVPGIENDSDLDGYRGCAGDCADGDPLRNPGAAEVCGDLDDDCDGNLGPDEVDSDGDGTTACDGDCDDASPSTHPGAPVTCGNGIDEDCGGGPLMLVHFDVPGDDTAGTLYMGDATDSAGVVSDDTGTWLRLTAAVPDQAARYAGDGVFTPTEGLTASFRFRVSGDGGDGFVLAFVPEGADLDGGWTYGGQLAFDGLDAFGLEIDTAYTAGLDPLGNHLGVDDGTTLSGAARSIGVDIESGDWIEVQIELARTGPAGAQVQATFTHLVEGDSEDVVLTEDGNGLDLRSLLDSGRAFRVGLFSATGSSSPQAHEVDDILVECIDGV